MNFSIKPPLLFSTTKALTNHETERFFKTPRLFNWRFVKQGASPILKAVTVQGEEETCSLKSVVANAMWQTNLR